MTIFLCPLRLILKKTNQKTFYSMFAGKQPHNGSNDYV